MLTKRTIIEKIENHHITGADLVELSVLAIRASQNYYETWPYAKRCDCVMCELLRKVEDLGLLD